MIILTSFEKSKFFQWQGNIKSADNCFSIARWQPHDFHYHPLPFLAPTMSGYPFTKEPPEKQKNAFIKYCIDYENALYKQYLQNLTHIKDWLFGLQKDKDYILCCWCPYSQSAQWQLKHYGKFFCHSFFVGEMIKRHSQLEVGFYPSTDYKDDNGKSKMFESFKKGEK